jgi:hypothetical protein
VECLFHLQKKEYFHESIVLSIGRWCYCLLNVSD